MASVLSLAFASAAWPGTHGSGGATTDRSKSSGAQYTVTFRNDSSNAADVCIFQQDPDISNSSVMSLAWFSKFSWPSTSVEFTWNEELSFVWDRTGTLQPGVIFSASQLWPADLSTTNQVTLTFADDLFTFANQTVGETSGALFIIEDGTIPLQQGSVGMGQSGAGTFVAQAQPNWELSFSPNPTYWIAFGNFTQGEVLDTLSISNAADIGFPLGIYHMQATLNVDNTWTISPVLVTPATIFIDGFESGDLSQWTVPIFQDGFESGNTDSWSSVISALCSSDGDCDDGNSFTVDACCIEDGSCENRQVVFQCSTDAGCSDGSPCTVDSCDPVTSTCVHLALAGCCDFADDCKDNNPCTTESCIGNQCEYTEKVDCCNVPSDCFDGDPCTIDSCNVSEHTCVFELRGATNHNFK